jgi:hypothetical protein
MRASAIALTLAILAAYTFTSTVAAQATIFTYTVHVDFFAYSCSLSITQVSLYDSFGSLVGVASSPYGGEVAISIRTTTPISTLTATAYGIATWSSYYTWPVNGSRSMILGNTGDYWITIRMS